MSNIFSQSDSPASQLQQTTQNYLDSWKNINAQTQLQTGLALNNSKDLKTRLQGSNLTNQAVQTSTDQRIQTNLDQTSSGNSFNWDQALNIIGGVGSQLGGTTGTVAQGIQKTGSYIKLASEAGKAGNLLGKAGGIGGAVGVAADTIGSFLPQKTEYEGPKGDITQTMDSVYDGISDAAMNFGPVGCVCAGSRVVNNEGKFLNIEDLIQEEGIIGWGNRKANRENIFALKTPDYKECLRIELESGTILECSTDHPILYAPKGRAERVTINGERKRVKQWIFKPAETLQIGDNVGIVNEIPIWGEQEMWNPYLVGMLIGDGTYGKDHGVRLYSGDPDTWNYIEKYQLGGRINFDDSQYSSEFRGYRIFNGAEQLRLLGMYEQTKCNKRLPINIHKYTKESICKLIAGLIDTDGCVQSSLARKEFKIIFYQKNETLIKQLREQLLKLGIHSSIQSTKERKSTIRGREINSSSGYKLVIKDKLSLVNFYNNISLNIQYKQKALEEIYSYCQLGSTKDNRLLSGAKADKVVSITSIGSKLVYNLQADDDHTYIANGIITHNTLVGGIMKGGAMLGKGMNALGGGTDGMTSTDAILGSSFFNLTPVGLVNGFGGATTDTITKDNEAFETVGNSYSGSNQTVNDALTKSGKKYGLLSHGAMNKANQEIAEAKRQQKIISNIADTTNTQNLLQQSMAGINTNKRKFQLQGGYNQASVLAAKHGAIVPTTISLSQETTIKLAEFKKGGSIAEKNLPEVVITPDEEYNYFINSLPENLKDYDDSYRMKRLWELSGSPKDFNQARKEGVFSATGKYKKTYHAPSVVLNNETGEYEFLKSAKHPTIRKELDWYYSDDPEATEFRNQYDLDDSGYPWYKYVKKEIPEFKEGGSVNLLPEGALHARKHHMDVEGITEKGIPVIDMKGNQQAEIEHSEIIYRLEVTQKLEELYKIYYSDDSSQEKKDKAALEAGKLLVYETLHNTQDNVGLLQNT